MACYHLVFVPKVPVVTATTNDKICNALQVVSDMPVITALYDTPICASQNLASSSFGTAR